MKTSKNQGNARIERHGLGVGAPTLGAVEIRARELAQIEGRPRDEAIEEDYLNAAKELHGDDESMTASDESSDVLATHNPADLAVETGHRIEAVKPDDTQEWTESAVMEGVREAEHERMLQGHRIKQGRA